MSFTGMSMQTENRLKIILASSSPRRKELLGAVLDGFTIAHADIDESAHDKEPPDKHTLRLAVEKAMKVKSGASASEAVIIAADTVVSIDGRLLGKPSDKNDARSMLRAIRGRTHSVFTSFCVIKVPEGRMLAKTVESLVKIKHIPDETLEDYLLTDEPFDKAGAYAVQGIAGTVFVEGVTGSYTNVIGLPMEELKETLAVFGVELKQ